jgi:hypothetical protein
MTIADPMHETPDELLEATSGLVEQRQVAVDIRQLLKEATFSG